MSDRPDERSYDPHRFPGFEPPYPSQTFDDVMYAVSGRDRAENHLITIARDQFWRCWLADEHMTVRLQTWSATIGLPEIINDVAAFLDRVADRYGFSRRADLARIPRPPHISVEDLLPEWYGLQDHLYAAYRRSPEVRDAACTYVCDELQQPWPWLAYRLTDHIFQQAWERAEGITMISRRTSHIDAIWEPREQSLRFVFEQKPGEPNAEARNRLIAEVKAACTDSRRREIQSQSVAKGQVREDREPITRRYTGWLYFHLVHKKKVTDLARAFHTERGVNHKTAYRVCSCGPNVRKGLKQAQRLLNLTPYYFEEIIT
jgi:hypothetical protein